MGIYKFFNNILEKLIAPGEPVQVLTKSVLELTDPITRTDLKHKTKKELEIIGRNLGIEVDRRLKKDKLVAQIKKRNRTV
jgi:nitrogenase molybdenum-iron protein alpha/beta subunit